MQEIAYSILIIESIITAVINGGLNALCAWLLNRNSAMIDVSLWPNAIGLFITFHCICILTATFAWFSAKRYKNTGYYTKCKRLSGFASTPTLLGILLADIFSIIGSIITTIIFGYMGIAELPLHTFVIYKTILGIIAGVSTNNIALKRFLLKKD